MLTSTQKSAGANATEPPILSPQRVSSEHNSTKQVKENGNKIEIDSYKDLISAFEIVLSKERPGVRIHFTGSQESVLAHKFLLEIKKDLPVAVSQLKEFLLAQGAPQGLIESIEAKFPPAQLQGLSLNKSQQLFATTNKGKPIPLLAGNPPLITKHGKALIAMLHEASKAGEDSKVTVNFVLPTPSNSKRIDVIREQLRELLSKGEEDLQLSPKFRDILQIVTRKNFNQTTLTYREPRTLTDFLNEQPSKVKKDSPPPVTEVSDTQNPALPEDVVPDYSTILRTFEIVCTPSDVPISWNRERGEENSVFFTSQSIDKSAPFYSEILQMTSPIFVGGGMESVLFSEDMAVSSSDAFRGEADLDTQVEYGPSTITRIQDLEEIFSEQAIEVFKDPARYDSAALRQCFKAEEWLYSYRIRFNEQLYNKELDRSIDARIAKIYEQVEALPNLLTPFLEARLSGYAPLDIPDRDNLITSFNKAGAKIMKSLANDSDLTVEQQTETWHAVEYLRGVASLLAQEPSMLPWRVSPIGPHHGRIKNVDSRTGDITVELDDDKRLVIWKDSNRRSDSGPTRHSSNLCIGDPVIAHVAILTPPVDSLSKEGAKRNVNFNGEPVNNHWRAARLERSGDNARKAEFRTPLKRKGLAQNSTRKKTDKRHLESAT